MKKTIIIVGIVGVVAVVGIAATVVLHNRNK